MSTIRLLNQISINRIIAVWLGLFILLTINSCTKNTESPEKHASDVTLAEFQKAIREKYDMKEQAFRDNDPEPILTRFYSEDVISTDPEGHTHMGRESLRPIYEEVIASLVRIESFNTFVNGDAGWDWVNFYVTFPPEIDAEPFTFKMLFLWERIDGEWWSHGEMYVLGEFNLSADNNLN
mgnify:CR=1 FL=1